MGIFNFILGPYIRAGKNIQQGLSNLKGMVQEAEEISDQAVDQLSGKTGNIVYVEASDEQKAFETLYEHNKWTEERLKAQHQAMRRIKWVCLVVLWVTICLMGGIAFLAPMGWGKLFLMGALGVTSFFFFVMTLKYAVFQTQIELRELISLKAFLSRTDMFVRVFS